MVVCRYFLEGRCYYGENCRFEHSSYDSGNRRYFAPQVPQPTQQTQQQTLRNGNDVKQVVVEEVRSTEAGKQWLFSCFSPLKEELVPGLDDISPEEMRHEAYQAIGQNTFDTYKLQVEQLKQDYLTKRNQLVNLDPTTLLDVLCKDKSGGAVSSSTPSFAQPASSPAAATSIFGNPTGQPPPYQAGNLFGGGTVTSTQQTAPSSTFSFNLLGGSTAPQQQSKSIFGGGSGFSQTPSAFGQPSASVFGQASSPASIFGQAAPATSTIFGGQTTITPSSSPFAGQSVFGQSPSTNVFGQTQSSTSSIFGQQPLVEQPSSSTNVFGQPQSTLSANVFGQVQTPTEQVSSTNVFGQTQSTFGNQATFTTPTPTAPLFGQTPVFTSPSVFGQAPQSTTSVFAQPQAQPSVFSTPAFSQPQNSSAAFTQPPTATNIFSQAAASFGQSTFTPASTQNSNPFSQTSFASPSEPAKVNPFTQVSAVVVSCNHYSNLEDLTEEEKKAFEATEFELGKIPIKPPPKELCF